jgi:hypothetical protein
VLAIEKRQLVVHRSPSDNGYLDVKVYEEDAVVSPLGAPHATVRVADLVV